MLESETQRLGLDAAVRFTGRQSMDRVRQYLKLADVFALVSRLEGFPCSLIEAMSTGLASVVSRIPANLQLVDDGVHGWSAALGNIEDLSAALNRLIENPEGRRKMGQVARQRIIDHYSTAKIAERYEELFALATADSPPVQA